MTKEEFEELYWKIVGLFDEHVGCLEEQCHCGGSSVDFADSLQKTMFEAIKIEEQ